MASPPPGRGSVAELTAALRRGLHPRRFAAPPAARPPLDPPAPLDVAAPLLPVSGLLGHPATAKASPARPLVRLARRIAKVLLRPWLELQTRFNHQLIGVLDQLHSWVRDNLGRVHDRCNDLERDAARAADAHDALARRVAECYEELLRERARVRRLADDLEALTAGGGPTVAAAPADVRLTGRVIETVFVHTRLPAPPARVLDLGSPLGPPDLAALGYQVTGVDPQELPARGAGFAALPCPDAGFDVAVAVGAFARPAGADAARFDRHVATEAYRALRPGGRLILTAPHDPTSLARLLAHFRPVETGYAAPTADGWVFTADPPASGGLALVVAEKD